MLESVVAFLVLAAGSVAVAQLQSHLRLAADVARERSEAVRLGEEALEDLKAFAAIDGPPGARTYAAIATASAVVAPASGAGRNAYRIERVVDAEAFAGTKAARVAVRWSDRGGGAHAVVVDAMIAAVDPAYSASLALDAGAIPAAPRGAHGRRPGLPLTAKSLGDGRSAWKPRERGATAWLFDDASGAIVAVCDGVATTIASRDLAADALRGCTSGGWLFVAGTLRAAATAPAVATTATTVRIDLHDGVYPRPPLCASEAKKTVRFVDDAGLHVEDVAADAEPAAFDVPRWEETGERFVAWHCAVAPRADGRWSGRIVVVASGWTIGGSTGDGRVCRFAAADDRAAIDANIASAGVEVDVGAVVSGRHFLVVRGSDPCPLPTAQHQP